ncbi:MAG: hypothetical protein HY001_01410 [Candidatus Portnoybacteria bacterium]|nr:hypothetical protein [Candidatus Portnoybacteria bacterium]
MTHEEFFKISIGIIAALLVGIGAGTAIYFFGKNKSNEMPVVSVPNEGGFPQAGERALKPYQYPEAKPRSYPQPSTPQPVTPPSPPPQTPSVKPTSGGVAPPTKLVYPNDYKPYNDTGEEGFNSSKESVTETE